MPLTDQDMKRVISATVHATFIELGLDTKDPIELQKDFAHLRAWRESTEEIKRKGTLTLLAIIVTGLGGLIWSALKTGLH